MATVGVVKAIVTADVAQLKKGMNEAQRSLDNFSKNAKAVGKSMTMKVTAPLIGAGVAAGKMASDFEFSMTQIETLVGRSAQEVDSLKGSVLGLSGETGRAPKELADAMFFITSAGLDATAATAALEASAKAAAVGLGDTVIVADAVTSAMNGYGMAADGAAFATDVLAKTVEQGKASAADLAPQFGQLIPMASELSISFDQVGAGLAFLTRASGDASLSSTQLAGVMKSLLKPSQQAKKTFEEIGIDIHQLRAAASQDLLGALQNLRQTLADNGKEMGQVFEDVRGLNGALQLTGVATDSAREVFDELANSTGKLDEAFLGVQKTAQFKISTAMAEIQAAFITLGEQVLPVVIPLIKSLAGFIGDLARMFGALPSGVQKAVVIIGVLAAAVGPLIWAIGSLTGALQTLGIVSQNVTIKMSAILPVIALVAVAAAGLFMWWNKVTSANKKNKEEMEMLRTEYLNNEQQTQTLADRVKKLTAEYQALTGTVESTVLEMDHFKGKTVLTGQLLDRDVIPAFNNLNIATGTLEAAVKTGTDAFNDSFTVKTMLKGSAEDLTDALDGEKLAVKRVAEEVKRAYDDNEINLKQAKDILRSIDETADAHDKLKETLNEEAEAVLTNGEEYLRLSNILGTKVVDATIQAAEESGNWHDELSALEPLIEKINVETKREAALTKKAAEELDKHNAYLDEQRNGFKNVSQEQAKSTATLNVYLDRLESGVDILQRSTSELEKLAATHRDADAAMLNSARVVTEEEKNRSYWTGVAARNKQKEADDTLAFETARETALKRYAIIARVSEGKRLDAEKAIAAAAERTERIKSKALDLANALQSVQQEVTSLEAEQTAIQEERQRTLEEIASISDEITKLMEDQANFSATNANFAAEIAQEFRKAELAIMNLEEKIADLQNEVDAVPPDASTQREFVAKLKDQREAVNTVEQALIDMNVIKEEDAGFMDLTAAEAQTLVRLQEQLQETQLDMENGEATVLDLMVAEEAWTKGMGSAMEASRELTKAEADLADMEAKATQIEKDRKKAMLELEIAQYDLIKAKEIGTEETYLASRAEEEHAKVQEVINGLIDKRTDLQEKQTELALKEIQVVDELKYANERLKSVMEELNNLGEDGNEIWKELMGLVHATTGEFRDLINLLKVEKGISSGGSTGSGGMTVSPVNAVTSTIAPVVASGVIANDFTTMLAGLTDDQRGLVGELFADVSAHRSGTGAMRGAMMSGSSIATNPNVIVNVEGSVISEADLTNAINLAMQKITQSGGTAPSYEGLGSFVDFGET